MKSIIENRLGLWLGLLLLLVLLLYHETAGAIWAVWNRDNNPTYSHGPLLFLVCLYFLYQGWKKYGQNNELRISYIGLVGVIGSSLLWFLAGVGSVQIIQMLSLVSVLSFLLIAALGFQQARPHLFPILLMIGALPLWEVFSPYLQLNSAVAAGWLTTLTIQPSIREGMLIHIPAGSFEVEAGCSGLAYFIVSILISLLYVHDYQMPIWRRLLFLLSAMLVAIIANIIRVYIIVLSGELTNMESYFIQVEHVSLGWVIFFIGISIYLWQAGRFLPEKAGNATDVDNKKEPVDLKSTMDEGVKEQDQIVNSAMSNLSAAYSMRKWSMSLAILVVVVCVGPLADKVYRPNEKTEASLEIQFPNMVGDWRRENYQGSYRPVLQRGTAMEEVSYSAVNQHENIYILVNHFTRQRQGAEAVSDMNRIAVKGKWTKVGSSIVHPNIVGFSDLNETRLRAKNGDEKLVWFWYETNGLRTGKGWRAKLQNIYGVLQGQPSIRTVVLATELTSTVANARKRLAGFYERVEGEIRVVDASSHDYKG